MSDKLNIGCGTHILEGWVNLDRVALPGVDIVHDLTSFPWPFQDHQFDEIFMKDVLEHLPDTIKTLEEIYRITKPCAKIFIAVPFWNSYESITDPTHVTWFNEYTFSFFDPSNKLCKDRHYYTIARFKIVKQTYVVTPFKPIIPLIRPLYFNNRALKKTLSFMALYVNNIISGLDIYLERL